MLQRTIKQGKAVMGDAILETVASEGLFKEVAFAKTQKDCEQCRHLGEEHSR